MGAQDKFFRVSEVIFQQILAVFIILVMWEVFKTDNWSSKYNWHIILNVLGVALCMVEGVQLFRKESTVTYGDSREEKSKIHMLVMCLGIVCLIIGTSLKISEISDFNGSHFNSIHGKLGLTAWILSFVTAIGGLLASNIIRINMNGRITKLLHIFLGVTTYIIALVALAYGLHHLVATNGRIFLIILLCITLVYSLIGACKSILGYVRN